MKENQSFIQWGALSPLLVSITSFLVSRESEYSPLFFEYTISLPDPLHAGVLQLSVGSVRRFTFSPVPVIV
jgi:hypothetical protein